MNLVIQNLRSWRAEQAEREKIEPFRVLSNAAIEQITEMMPHTREELLTVKGIKEKKFEKYGSQILEIVREHTLLKRNDDRQGVLVDELGRKEGDEKIFSVGQFLDLLNIGLRASEAKIVGEVSGCDFRGNYLFFTFKDKTDGSAISCFMWQREYQMSGVVLATGMEIIAHGFPEIYKPSGRLSFRADSIELVGEGALKKAYDELKFKLEREGLFAIGRKAAIPEYPEKIGLITSKAGAVIHDFLNNIGKFGYHIQFIDSRVEGQLAVPDLVAAVRSFRTRDIDVLVLIRGGGSLESLLAFNNEMLVREIARFPKPVICGIGHDKDMPLAALAADIAVSTPTAVTRVLNTSWENAINVLRLAERDTIGVYQESLLQQRFLLEAFARGIQGNFSRILAHLRHLEKKIRESMIRTGFALQGWQRQIGEYTLLLVRQFDVRVETVRERLLQTEKSLAAYSPDRQLRLGYSIARIRGKVIRSVQDVYQGDQLDITVSDGMITSEVTQKKTQKHDKIKR